MSPPLRREMRAAIRDMLNVTHRRFANLHIVIAPARVQGAEAVPEIVSSIQLLNSLPDPPDVIIVGLPPARLGVPASRRHAEIRHPRFRPVTLLC